MKLTENAISHFKRNTRLKTLLALELDCSVFTIDRYVSSNDSNGRLTTAKAIQVIKQETGLEDSEILEEETENETVK